MALVSGIITINSKNEFSTFKRMQVSDITDLLKLPKQLQYEIGIDQSTSCTGIYIQDTKNLVNILLELEYANKDKKDYFADIFYAEIKTSDVPPITISKDDFKDGKYIKQLNAPKVYGITKEALSTLKCEFRLAKENSEAVSIDSKTGKTVKNNTKGNISVSPDGTLTIKSTEKETYVVECIITTDHYKTLAKSIISM